jgi:hypothetical protein
MWVIEKTIAHIGQAVERAQREIAEVRKSEEKGSATTEKLVLANVRTQERAELIRDLVSEGVPVHEVSTLLYALLGLVLWATNRRRLARTEAEGIARPVPAPPKPPAKVEEKKADEKPAAAKADEKPAEKPDEEKKPEPVAASDGNGVADHSGR